MLTENQKNYLLTIPESKTVEIYPFDEKIIETANSVIQKINEATPELEVVYIGASALKISGQKDIDINILSEPQYFDKYLPRLTKVLGKPSAIGGVIEWNFVKNGYELEVYLTDINSEGLKEQLRVFNILKDNPNLLKKYEDLKEKLNGDSFREYQRRKYEFYNKILN